MNHTLLKDTLINSLIKSLPSYVHLYSGYDIIHKNFKIEHDKSRHALSFHNYYDSSLICIISYHDGEIDVYNLTLSKSKQQFKQDLPMIYLIMNQGGILDSLSPTDEW